MAKESKRSFQTHPLLDTLRNEIKKVTDHWGVQKKSISSEPSAHGVQGLSKEDFDQYISSLNLLINSEEAAATFNPVAASHLIRTSTLINHVNNMVAQINNTVGNPGHWPHLCDHAYTLSNYLQMCMFGGSGWVSNSANTTREAMGLFGQSKQMYGDALKVIEEAKASKDESDKYKIEAREILKNAEDTQTKIKDEIKELDKYKEGINQSGLGRSFSQQVENLKWTSRLWAGLFILTLGLFAGISLSPVIKDVFADKKVLSQVAVDLNVSNNRNEQTENQSKLSEQSFQITNSHQKDALETLITTLYRILMCSPLIWLAWFSGRQFNSNKRLISEYAYKEAVAKAYYGYKQEAKGNESLEAKLLEGAITAFNKNPSEEMNNHHSVSPYEELFGMIFKGAKADSIMSQFIELVKAGRGK